MALPRKVQYRAMEGDPQTRLQDDKDPMLIVRGHVPEGQALDPELDPDPEGDLGMCTQTHVNPGKRLCAGLYRAAQG